MKKKLISIITSFALAFSMVPAPSLAWASEPEQGETQTATVDYGTPGEDYAEGEAVVLVQGGAEALQSEAGQASLMGADGQAVSFTVDETLATVSTGSASDCVDEGASLLDADGDVDILQVSGADTEDLIAALEDLDCVLYAQPNYYYELVDDDTVADVAVTSNTETSAISEASLASTDAVGGSAEPMYQYQWGLNNTYEGQSANSLQVGEAWADGAGSDAEVVVALIDSGVDYTHEDLKDSMWSKGLDYPELTALGGGQYGIAMTNPESTDPIDTKVGHGTHCASVIAAAWNNIGIAGINGNAKIMACETLGGTSARSTTSATAKCFQYIITAKKCGVNVCEISNSWGSSAFWVSEDRALDALVTEAGENGIITVFAAGNSNINHDYDSTAQRTASKYMLTVGALTSEGTAASFSNYGVRDVDVFSPGTRILACTTSSGKAETMPPQYVPWATDVNADGTLADTTYFLDTYEEGATSTVSYKLYKKDAAGTSTLVNATPASVVSGGYASTNRVCLSLDGLKAGDSFYYEMSIPADMAQQIGDQEAFNFAAMISMDSSKFSGGSLTLQFIHDGAWGASTDKIGMEDPNWSNADVHINNALTRQADGTIQLRLAGTAAVDCDDAACIYLDDVALGSGISKAYYYSDGTSMACPGVTGTASLLSSYNALTEPLQSAKSAAEIVAYIKGGVTVTDALAEKCNMSGIANADTSYTAYKNKDEDAMLPVSQTLAAAGDGLYTLSGYFYGNQAGTLTVDGTVAEVTSWTDSSITFKNVSTAEHLSVVAVTKANGKTASRTMNIPAGSYGYTSLATPDIKITYENNTYDLRNGLNRRMVAAGDSLYVGGVLAEECVPYLLRYDTVAATWSQLNITVPEGYTFNSLDTMFPCGQSLATDGSKLYLEYPVCKIEDNNAEEVLLATYDVATNELVGDPIVLPEGCNRGTLACYQGEIYILGCLSNAALAEFKAAYKCDPATGEVTRLADLPASVCGGNVSVWDGGMVFVSDINSPVAWMPSLGERFLPKASRSVLVYTASTNTWTEAFAGFNAINEATAGSTPYTDIDITFGAGSAGYASGAVVTGPVRHNGQSDMVDTWLLDAATGAVHAVEGVRFDSARTQYTTAAIVGDTYYVLGYSSLTSDYKFSCIKLSKLGAKAARSAYSISFDKDNVNLLTGASAELTATVTGTIDPVTVTSSNPAVATAAFDSATGKLTITATGAGTATITVTPASDDTYAANHAATITVTVKDSSVGRFSDVQDPSDWYYQSVYDSVDMSLFEGYDNGTFGPNDSMTRAQAAVVLWRHYAPEAAAAYDESKANNETRWADVEGGKWYTGAANWAFANGVFSGRDQEDGTTVLDPEATMTREELMAVLANCATKFAGADVPGASDEQLKTRADVKQVSSWAYQSAAWCVQTGVVSGKDIDGQQYVAPADKVTRAEMATLMVNAVRADVIG